MTNKGVVAACLGALALATIELRAEIIEPVSFGDGDWLKPQQAIRFRLPQLDQLGSERLAFFIGQRDVSALMRQSGLTEFTYAADILPLPSGEQTLTVYAVSGDNQWRTFAELPLRILTPAGFERADHQVRFDVTEKSQFSAKATGDAFAPEPDTYHNMALSAGLNGDMQRGPWRWRHTWNVVGTSVREEALRFGELQDEAPKTDLSDYLMEVEYGDALLALGHVNFGNHPLLVNGLANRGLMGRWQVNRRMQLAVTSQSGQIITGYDNLLGLRDYDNNSVQAASMGYEFFPDANAALRMEVSFINAEVTSDLGFNIGEVPDAERSDGIGLSLQGQSSGGRLRVGLNLAESTYDNPNDPALAQGDVLVQSAQSTDRARSANLEYVLLQPDPNTGEGARVNVQLRHEQSDPLYKSVGAFVAADQRRDSVALTGQLGQVSWQAQYNRGRDNLDELDSVLTTVTETTAFNVNIPLQWLQENPRAWLPSNIGYNGQRVHQFGDNLPIGFDPATHIPDQVNVLHDVNLSWQLGGYGITYTYNRSDQDNRQPGRAQADFRDINHGLSFNLPLTDSLNVSLALGTVDAIDREQQLTRYNDSASLNVSWRLTDNLSIDGSYALTRGGDSENFTESENYTTQTQVNYQFSLPGFNGRDMPGQLFIRHVLSDNFTSDNQFQFESAGRNWSVNGGVNLSLF